MALVEFKDLPDTSTPINAENLNNNFNELNNDFNNLNNLQYKTVNGVDINVSSGTATQLNSITLGKGFWIIIGMFSFSSNTSGARRCNFSTQSASTDMNFNVAPALASATRIRNIDFFNLSGDTTIYANVLQNSGSNLTCYCQMKAVKLADYQS